ncbi:MAG: hypothetical protein HUU21_02530 [Polyangiaceae bacterium]|nr:hypothetical protein [Polyangiaceae bacterium]
MNSAVLDFILHSEASSPVAVELRGFICAQDDRCLIVKDSEGLWIIKKEDVIEIQPWEPGSSATSDAPSQHPVLLRIRDDAEITEMRRFRITTKIDLPMTVAVAQQSTFPVRHLGVAAMQDRQLPCGPITTVCTVYRGGLVLTFDDAQCR